MDYEQKYNEALRKIRELIERGKENGWTITTYVKDFEQIFPELKDSEDEKIRKALIEMVHDTTGDALWIDYNVHKEECIAWLEKQNSQILANSEKTCKDEQKPADKNEPKSLEECEIEHIEHGKYYYCIKDYYAGGNKRASKGDVVQALNGMSMMALGVKANEYFMPINNIEQKPADKCELTT